ncbi:unnamed protein product [Hymenolepis diminuta]|uniref:DUF5727 domain-containing protein n=1 Tax=Hymenolepis diminuta TaxID=6216 RepID=A0A564Y938_HYMDI|nr:unnamed protein product [Hymenolepis diminuta]
MHSKCKEDLMAPNMQALLVIGFLVSGIACTYVTLPDDTRVIKGIENSTYVYKTTLPGNYEQLFLYLKQTEVVDLKDGICTSTMFECSYKLESEDLMYVTISGVISADLKWITFKGPHLVPISVFFTLTNTTDINLAMGTMQPQYSFPLIIRAKGKKSVTMTCAIFPKLLERVKYKLSTFLNNTVYYEVKQITTSNKIKDYSQILNVEIVSVVLHKVNRITVKQVNDIDFYSCEYSDKSITHVIDWTTAQPDSANTIRIQFTIFLACLLYLGF